MAAELLEGLRDMPTDVLAFAPESDAYPKTFYNPKHKHKKIVSDTPGLMLEFDDGVIQVWNADQERRVRSASGAFLFEPDLPPDKPDLVVEASGWRTRSYGAFQFELQRLSRYV